MTLDALLALLDRPRKTGKEWVARCPAHSPDRRPSLGIGATHDRVLLHCRAGCQTKAVCDALGLTLAELFFDDRKPREHRDTRTTPRRERPEDLEYALWCCSLGLRLRALGVLDAATGCDTATWTDDDRDRAMRYVIRAHDDLRQAETCDVLAFAMRCEHHGKARAAA
jgi:hypothetical protein